MTQPAPSRARRVLTSYPVRVIGTLVVVLGAVVLAGRMGWFVDNPSEPAQRSTVAAAAPALPPGQIGEGVWLVGTDVAPGTYRSSGPADGGYCMWSRHSTAAGGPMDAIISSDGDYDIRQMIVTIEPTDALFRTAGCAPFEKVG